MVSMEIPEVGLMIDADLRAARYLASVARRPVFPNQKAIDGLVAFDVPLPEVGGMASEILEQLDVIGSPGTITTNGPRYFGLVVGAVLPAAAAAERLMLAWDQGVASPTCAALEAIAAKWLLDILRLPQEAAVGFGSSATACGLSCLAAARTALLSRQGWDVHRDGLHGAPEVRVVVSDVVHVSVIKALRILGFGIQRIRRATTDEYGRIDPKHMPEVDELTILCLQAGEVNSGEFDPFKELIPFAKARGAWVHIDGAFGLWARASSSRAYLAAGVDAADSWTVDGHKWLNTPYDCAVAICRHRDDLIAEMNSDTVYVAGSETAQRNLTLDFSRRPRGIYVWAVLRALGRSGVGEMVSRHCQMATRLAEILRESGFEILNRVVLNQVLVRGRDDVETVSIMERAQRTGTVWFGQTNWRGRTAFRLSVCSWRTTEEDIMLLAKILIESRESYRSDASN